MRIIMLVVLFASWSLSYGNEAIIKDVENLLDSLSEKDSGRKELTLRLADLYFFEAVDLDKRARLVDKGAKALDQKAMRFRRRSLNLYRKAINKYQVNEETRIKVEFQLARIHDQLGRIQEALPYWRKSYRQKQVLNVRREAILKLAADAENSFALKKAESLYKEALTLCEASCGFIHYRLGWVYRNQGRIIPALEEVKRALWDKKGQAQDEVLRDYLAFLSQRPGDGSQAISIVENLVERTGRKNLLEDLAYGFYAAGNKVAGTKVLAMVTKRNPTLKNQVRLLEEYYGLRKWDAFRELRERVSPSEVAKLDKDSKRDVEKIMRRLAVQLEAEQKQNKKVTGEFLDVNSLYLELFPRSDIALKVVRSWLGVEKRPTVKIDKIAHWLGSGRFKFSKEEEVELREERARLAQEEKQYEVLRSEMGWLVKNYQSTQKREKAEYLIAYSHYNENKLDVALPLFVKLSQTDSFSPSKWAIQSLNLSLDIFNQRKDYDGLIKQADSWLTRNWNSTGKIRKDLTEIRKIREQANFEKAVSAGESQEALTIFFDYCHKGAFVPKSCQNAKRLSVVLKDQSKLMAVLKKTNEKDALTGEYEISGHYAKAAALLAEKTPLKKKKWSFEHAIKIALLYELEANYKERDRWLGAMISRYKKKAIPPKGEELFYKTLKDTGKLSSKHFSLKWSKAVQKRLARFLEESGQGDKRTRRLFLSQKGGQGKLWEYYHLKKIFELAQGERKTTFYGKRSKRRFQQRLRRIKKLDKYASKVLEEFSPQGRIDTLGVLYHAYNNLDQEIRNTPIPKEVDETAIVQIKNSLMGMARPFSDKAASYKELFGTELAKVEDESLKMAGEERLEKEVAPKVLLAALERPLPTKKQTVMDLEGVFPLLRQLHKNPLSRETVGALKSCMQTRDRCD